MPKLFVTDFCLSGMCIKDAIVNALVMERVASDPKDQAMYRQRREELLNEFMRLNDEQEIHRTKK